jgi:hypothetical protein
MAQVAVGVFVLLIGLVVAAIAVAMVVAELRFRAGAVTTEGAVIDMLSRPGTDAAGRAETLGAPVIGFTLADGTQRRVHPPFAPVREPDRYSLGETLGIRYRPEAPQSWRFVGIRHSWIGALVCGILGGTFAAVGLLVIVTNAG